MRRIARISAPLTIPALLAAASGGSAPPPAATASGAATAAAKYPTKAIDIMAPAATGGGFDTTARLVQRALTEEKLVTTNVTVSNVPGAGGTVGMAQLLKNKGDSHGLIVVGRVTVGSQITGKTEAKVSQLDRKSTRLNSSHLVISYAVFCLKKKK